MVMLSRSMANFISVARSTDGGFQKSGAMSGLKYEATKRSGASFIVKKLRQFGLEEPPPKKKKKNAQTVNLLRKPTQKWPHSGAAMLFCGLREIGDTKHPHRTPLLFPPPRNDRGIFQGTALETLKFTPKGQ